MFSHISPFPNLPTPHGPHKVGSTEFEIPISSVPSDIPFPSPEISTVRFRAFYPTPSASTSRKPVYWLPDPQTDYLRAYVRMLDARAWISSALSNIPLYLRTTTMPAVRDAPLLPHPDSKPYPVLVFSHGLAGFGNIHSTLLCSLASCGIVCVALEHRDGSAAYSNIRVPSKDGASTTFSPIPYKSFPHRTDPEILTGRNDQLRIRLHEISLAYAALGTLNAGQSLPNLATHFNPITPGLLDLGAGSVTWAGHSFGGATIIQFVKSVFYQNALPKPKNAISYPGSENISLFAPSSSSTSASPPPLTDQITPRSPVLLIDPWAMPLNSPATSWLWAKPLPCYAPSSTTTANNPNSTSNTMAIQTSQFSTWGQLHNGTRALLSPTPSNPHSSHRTQIESANMPRLFTVSNAAHLSHSDFGFLFPWFAHRFLGQEKPERLLEVSVRAILQGFRERGISVGDVRLANGKREEDVGGVKGWDEAILKFDTGVDGWERVHLTK